MQTQTDIFGHLPSGDAVHRVVITGGGLTAHILTWGSVIQDLRLDGHSAPLVLGFDNLQDHLDHSPYFGATPGRNANRIGGGRFSIDGTEYQLENNENGVTHLHGGSDGLAKRIWDIVELAENRVVLRVVDPDGRAGYPGNCTVTCTYTLSDGGVLNVLYESSTDRATICNVCQHSYFNLDGTADALGHDVMIAANDYLPTDERLVPTGEVRPVEGTAFDLRSMTSMRRQLEGDKIGYDHNFCLSGARGPKQSVALVRSINSGVSLEVRTTEPGVQFYTGFKMNVPVPGLEGRRYGPFAGFCLETQIWPDAVNHANFPKAVLRPGDTLRQETDYVFTKS
ncbi:MAG TPA: aldose epimerase family protein [Pararhizobium sp.]|uniref:aldose epimerase family protein n=1 Tax=Pararhizobium sp. TaxID=1977563 RepID=UPI002BF6F35F|nr:aldose epimerase family protein [Pararhizobium sp.]HTO30299.1 aldose epimerase family protein [Pararhizobium sp.]